MSGRLIEKEHVSISNFAHSEPPLLGCTHPSIHIGGPERENALSCCPLPGFQFMGCKSKAVSVVQNNMFCCGEATIAAILVLEGTCHYTLNNKHEATHEVRRNMFIVGRWNDVDVEVTVPIQKAFSYIGFMVHEAALSKHFGHGMGSEIGQIVDRIVERRPDSMSTFSGLARPDALVAARHIVSMQCREGAESFGCRCGMLNLFAKFFHQVSEVDIQPEMHLDKVDKERLAGLKTIIEADFKSIETAADVCSTIGMSFSKANKVFKAIYSMTIAQYIQQCKMLYAYDTLFQRQLNVSECAFAVGYSNISHFISAFKKYYGMTPKGVSKQQGTVGF